MQRIIQILKSAGRQAHRLHPQSPSLLSGEGFERVQRAGQRALPADKQEEYQLDHHAWQPSVMQQLQPTLQLCLHTNADHGDLLLVDGLLTLTFRHCNLTCESKKGYCNLTAAQHKQQSHQILF